MHAIARLTRLQLPALLSAIGSVFVVFKGEETRESMPKPFPFFGE